MSMLDWNGYRADLRQGFADLGKLNPPTIKGYAALNEPPPNSVIDLKTRELIALAVAVTVRCDGCITFHTEAAVKHGATKAEIAEALGVATSVNAGASIIYSLRTLDAHDALPQA
ncbi:MAG: carboxymuconolactone decarboxylase family protein [Caulobacter sp.]|nr:carboxymuconolactone decarboxylase family protein [Caulobacter sp.]